MKISFGIDTRKVLTGAELTVRIFQIATLMIVPYIFIGSGHMKIFTSTNPFSILFDLGMSVLPRAEVMAMSLIYRSTGSEVIILFASLILALIIGIIAPRLLKTKYDPGVRSRKVLCVLLIIDLVIRLIPMKFNLAFGLIFSIIGFLIVLGCLILNIMDLKTVKK